MLNPECCGVAMWLDEPEDRVWDYFPGSPEIRQLFELGARGVSRIWVCFDCGRFMPAEVPGGTRAWFEGAG